MGDDTVIAPMSLSSSLSEISKGLAEELPKYVAYFNAIRHTPWPCTVAVLRVNRTAFAIKTENGIPRPRVKRTISLEDRKRYTYAMGMFTAPKRTLFERQKTVYLGRGMFIALSVQFLP